MYQYIHVTTENGVGVVTINRPDKRNALNASVLSELEQAVAQMEENEEVRTIVITGEGEKSFAAGADIKELNERKMLDAFSSTMQSVYRRIENSSKVTIARMNGYALGGGLELALACDIRIAPFDMKVGLPELGLGIIPGGGGTQRLTRLIGYGKAKELILTGKILTGEEAFQYGLVTAVTERDNLDQLVEEYADQIKKKAPISIKLAKKVMDQGFNTDMETALLLEKYAQTIAFGTEDRNEGTGAFLEKRKPSFQNQ